MKRANEFNPKFLKLFNEIELRDIVKSASAYGNDCLVVTTEDYFFELSADIGNEVEIYCENNTSFEANKLSKEEFLHLYKTSPLSKLSCLSVKE
ncbi:MAG: hypothetical protein Q9M43_04500 [Sulfurimonas sp.]|nr:hypothetical protein [Sulfurimonas sp.]